jgi:hypothetical protein
MRQAKRDQAQAEKSPRDPHTLIAYETNASVVPRDPGTQDPCGAHHHRSRTRRPPSADLGRDDEPGHSQHKQPNQEPAEKYAGRNGSRAPPEQSGAAREVNKVANVGEHMARRYRLGNRLPARGKIAFDQTKYPKADQHNGKDCMTYAHRPEFKTIPVD